MVADTTADEGISEVREHIEKVVETLVGDNLDQTSVLKLVNHSSCKIQWFHAWHYKFFDLKTCFADDRIFILFHRNLSDALTQLAQAIYAVLSRNIFFLCVAIRLSENIIFYLQIILQKREKLLAKLILVWNIWLMHWLKKSEKILVLKWVQNFFKMNYFNCRESTTVYGIKCMHLFEFPKQQLSVSVLVMLQHYTASSMW